MIQKGQSAFDFLITYSFAIFIIAIIIGLLFFFVLLPQTIPPNECSFPNSINCIDMIFMVNTTSHISIMAILANNKNDYPIFGPNLTISINGVNTTGLCGPQFVPPGGKIFCVVNSTKYGASINQFEAGNLYMSSNECETVSNPYNATQCKENGIATISFGHFLIRAGLYIRSKLSLPNLTGGINYSLIEIPDPVNGGRVEPGSGNYPILSSITISAIPSSGWYFKNWTGVGAGNYTGTSSLATITMIGNISETAYFSLTSSSTSSTSTTSTSPTTSTSTTSTTSTSTTSTSTTSTTSTSTTSTSTTSTSTTSSSTTSTTSTSTTSIPPVSFSGGGGLACLYANTSLLYATYGGSTSGSVAIIDTNTGSQVGIISGFDNPYGVSGVSIAPNWTTYIYVANYNNNTVSIINTSSGKINGTINGFDLPTGVAIAPNGKYAYVTDAVTVGSLSNSVSIVNTATKTITGTVTGFDDPYGVAIAPNGAYAYVTNYLNNTVSIVDTSTSTITGTITGFDGPEGVAFAPNGAYAYVTNWWNSTISIVDTSTGAITGTIQEFSFAEPTGVAIAPNGAYAYVANYNRGNGVISIVNTSTSSIVGNVSGTFADLEDVSFGPPCDQPYYEIGWLAKSGVNVTVLGNDLNLSKGSGNDGTLGSGNNLLLLPYNLRGLPYEFVCVGADGISGPTYGTVSCPFNKSQSAFIYGLPGPTNVSINTQTATITSKYTEPVGNQSILLSFNMYNSSGLLTVASIKQVYTYFYKIWWCEDVNVNSSGAGCYWSLQNFTDYTIYPTATLGEVPAFAVNSSGDIKCGAINYWNNTPEFGYIICGNWQSAKQISPISASAIPTYTNTSYMIFPLYTWYYGIWQPQGAQPGSIWGIQYGVYNHAGVLVDNTGSRACVPANGWGAISYHIKNYSSFYCPQYATYAVNLTNASSNIVTKYWYSVPYYSGVFVGWNSEYFPATLNYYYNGLPHVILNNETYSVGLTNGKTWTHWPISILNITARVGGGFDYIKSVTDTAKITVIQFDPN